MDARVAERAFVGRLSELQVLDDELRLAGDRRPRMVWIEGPPGVGKSALVRAFLARTSPAVVLRASGDEAEASVKWGILEQLARSGRPHRCQPLEALRELDPATDPLVAGRLILDALGALQGTGAVVVVVDDLHWADVPSAGALRFALRRLAGDEVLAVLVARSDEAPRLDTAWERLVEESGQRVVLSGLSPTEVARLVTVLRGGRQSISDAAAFRLWEHTEGSPLYVHHLVEELDFESLSRTTGPLPAPRSLASVIQARLSTCSAETESLVAAVAVLGLRCPLVQAVTVSGVEDPARALGEAVDARLLVEHEPAGPREVGFDHPLVRSAVYGDLNPELRSQLHAKAAALTRGAVALGHRLASACGPDEALASDLEQTARREAAEGRVVASGRHLAQAAEVSSSADQSARRLLKAAETWLGAGQLREVARRRSELEELPPSRRRDYVLGDLALLEGHPAAAKQCLGAVWAELREEDGRGRLAGWVAMMLASAHLVDLEWEEALACVERAEDVGGSALAATALGMAGRPQEGLARIARFSDDGHPLSQMVILVAGGRLRMYLDDLEGARADLEAATAPGTATAASFARPATLALLSDVHYRRGALDDATVVADLSLSVGREAGVEAELVEAAARAAYPAAARGDWTAAEAHVRLAAQLATRSEARSYTAYAASAAWALAVARDDLEQMGRATQAFAAASHVPELSMFGFGAIGAEGKLRCGRLDEAEAELARYESQAKRLRRASALRGAAMVRGMLEAHRDREGPAVSALEEGLKIAAGLPASVETARLHATYGTVLARFGHRARAIVALEEARARFAAIGAHPYRERVEAQLAELGRRTRRSTSARELTSTEAVVARLVTTGLSNKEVAARLVVSPKAVEYHLANIYAKLHVSSRRQLPAALASLGTKGTAEAAKD